MIELAMGTLPSSDAPGPQFELRCWGEFELRNLWRGETCTPRGRKARAIIAYLAVQGVPVGRERLAGLLWSERGDEQARASLRQTLFELRPQSPTCGLLAIDRVQVGLDWGTLTTDIARIEALANKGDLDGLAEALRKHGDRLYAGLDGLDPAFDEWLAMERQRQLDHVLAIGLSAAASGMEEGAFDAVSRLATVLQAFDETNEMVARIAMQADQARGDHGSVHRRYRRLQDAMRLQLDALPSSETKALLVEMLAKDQFPSARSARAAALQRSGRIPPTIAVLGFDDRSSQPEDAIFAARLADDLAAALSLSPWMNVLSAKATVARSEEAGDLSKLRRELGASYLLQGNVRRNGEGLRVTATLLEADSGAILWTRVFDWPHNETSARQEDHVMELAGHVSGQVQRLETMRALQKTEGHDAWDAYLLATLLSVFQCPTRGGWEAAVAYSQQAVDLDPNDGAAYATLAANQGQLLHHRGGDDPKLAERIAENIRRAQMLDPNNPAAMAEIAGGLIGLRKLAEALPLAERAVSMSPGDDNARHMLGAILARLGRSDEAIAELDVADRLTPNGTWVYLSTLNRSIAHLHAGRTELAAQLVANLAPILPGPELLLQCSLCFAKLDQWDRAGDAIQQLREVEPEISRELAENLIRGLYCAAGAADEYAAIIRRVWDERWSGVLQS